MHYGPGKRHYIDGGLVANNPSMCALVSAAEHLRTEHKRHREPSVRPWLDNVCMLSLGASESAVERRATVRPPSGDTVPFAKGNPMPRGEGLPDESTASTREILESQERMKIDRWPERDIDWGWFQ